MFVDAPILARASCFALIGALAAIPGTSAAGGPQVDRYTVASLSGVSAISRSDVWAVGTDKHAPLAKHWDGTDWLTVSTPALGGHGSLAGVSAVSSSDVWAAGSVVGPAPGVQTVIEHWDGSEWTRVPSPNPGPHGSYLAAISADSPTDAWAVGYTVEQVGFIDHWDGISWQEVESPVVGSLTGVSASAPDSVWVVGSGSIEHWDGSNWSALSNPLEASYYAVDADSTADSWLGGTLGQLTVMYHYTGSGSAGGTSVSPGDSNQIYGVHAANSTEAWAVGSFSRNGGAEKSLAIYCHKANCHRSSARTFVGHKTNLFAISGTSSTDVWAVGRHMLHGRDSFNLIEHWDGSSWAIVVS